MNNTIDFAVKREQVFTADGMYVGKHAIRRADDLSLLGVVGENYRLIEHKNAVESAEKVLAQIGTYKRVSMEVTKNGARLYAKYAFLDMAFKVTARNGEIDSVAPTLTLSNSYDGLLKFGFILGAYQFICSNGLRIGHDIFEIIHRHTAGLELDGIFKNASTAMDYFKEKTYPRYVELSETPMDSPKEFLENLVLEKHVPLRLTDRVSERVIGNANVRTNWDLYSEFTHLLTHDADKMSYERKDQVGQIVARAFGL
ncbi:MAG: DUF945 domain-containing protein [Elusimicrobia bacterium]|nr:DUF945 domain-containing protein [Candidatus Liberimonas magnetica]